MSAAHLIELPAGNDTTAEHWPPLIPLGGSGALPTIKPELLPGWAGRFAAELAKATETPEPLAASMVLAACSVAAARRFEIEVKPGYIEPLNLWIIAAMAPGNRKSAVQAAACKPLTDWQFTQQAELEPRIKRAASDLRTAEERAKVLRTKTAKEPDEIERAKLGEELAALESSMPEIPRVPVLWASDATPERMGALLADNGERMAWLSSEGGLFEILAGRYSSGAPNLDLMLKAHSGDSERVERNNRPPVYLERPLLTIGLSPQPSILEGLAAKPGFRGRGLLGRFLYLLPETAVGYRTFEAEPVSEEAMRAYSIGLQSILNAEPFDHENPGAMHTLTISDAAYGAWHAYALKVEEQMRAGGSLELMADWGGKAPGAAARIAGVLHCIKHRGRHDRLEIDASTMNDALEIMAVFQAHSIRAMGSMGADERIAGAKFVWEWLRRNGRETITARDLFNAVKSRFTTMAKLEPVLDSLEERGYIQIIRIEPTGIGRPPSPVILIRQGVVS